MAIDKKTMEVGKSPKSKSDFRSISKLFLKICKLEFM